MDNDSWTSASAGDVNVLSGPMLSSDEAKEEISIGESPRGGATVTENMNWCVLPREQN